MVFHYKIALIFGIGYIDPIKAPSDSMI